MRACVCACVRACCTSLSTALQSYHDGGDVIALGFQVLLALMRRAVDTRHKCTTQTYCLETGSISPGFILLRVARKQPVPFNAFGVARPKDQTNDLLTSRRTF